MPAVEAEMVPRSWSLTHGALRLVSKRNEIAAKTAASAAPRLGVEQESRGFKESGGHLGSLLG